LNGTHRLEPDPLVEQLRPDPSEPTNIIALDGYLGRSDTDDNWRLYRDLSLTLWLEIPESAIHHTETVTVPGGLHPLTVVWVDRDQDLTATTIGREDDRSDFLKGTFTADALLADRSQPWAAGYGLTRYWVHTHCM
jgi:hypothetical protein